MKRFYLLFTFFLCGLNVYALQNGCHFGLKGEFLYLKPTNEISFASLENGAGLTTFLYNVPDYKPGFRVEGLYAFGCQNVLHGRFTYYNTGKVHRVVTGSFITPIALEGTFDDTLKIKYYSIEALFGRWLFDACDFDLELDAGLVYSSIKYTESTAIDMPITFPRNQLKFWGVGPEVAINLGYKLPRCYEFGFVFDARASLLVARTSNFKTDINVGSLTSEPSFQVTPAADIKLGVDWTHNWRCLSVNFGLGYEWIYYHQAITFFDASFASKTFNTSFSGPYGTLSLIF